MTREAALLSGWLPGLPISRALATLHSGIDDHCRKNAGEQVELLESNGLSGDSNGGRRAQARPIVQTSQESFVRVILVGILSALICSTLVAAPAAKPAPAGVTDDLIKSLTRCSVPISISRQPLDWRMPQGVKAEVILVQSDSAFCANQMAAITLPSGRFFLGGPWPLADVPGTREEKIKTFAWTRMKETVVPKIDAQKIDGFQKVTLTHKTEYGNMTSEGWIDSAGLIFLSGDLFQPGVDIPKQRAAAIQKVSGTPSTGPLTAAVTLVEFSDFQCPSCRAGNSYMKQILRKYGDKIRYVRVDFPIMSHHPWAFGAAAAGRAIYRLSPEAFWKFKDWVYENQDSLSTFTLDEFAVNFVKDNGLDVARYDKDLNSAEVKSQILSNVGLAHDIDVGATPTYMVNGVFIDPGQNGQAIDSYLAQKLAGK